MARRGKIRNGEPTVPAGPFSSWLMDRVQQYEREADLDNDASRKSAAASSTVARELGWGDREAGVRRLYRYKNQIVQKTAERKKIQWTETAEVWARSVVEDALHKVDPDLFYTMYPEFVHERDVVLELDAYCPFCEEYVTPVDGLCPWCVCEHGHLFREVGVSEDGFACLGCAKKEEYERRKRDGQRRKEREREQREAA